MQLDERNEFTQHLKGIAPMPAEVKIQLVYFDQLLYIG